MSKVEQLITEHIDIWTSAILAKSTAGRGSNKKYELYGIKKLRELILELAVRGKLVPQDSSDEPASVLLEQIAAAKAEQIKEGNIRKSKLLPEISEEDKLFELPFGWEWVNTNEVFGLENGDRSKNYPNKSALVSDGIPFINAGQLVDGVISKEDLGYITEERFDILNGGKFTDGDILFCLRGSLGKCALVTDFGRGAIASSLIIMRPIISQLQNFMMLVLKSPVTKKSIYKYDNGTAQPNLSGADLARFPVPLPPVNEQQRIVAKVDELMLLCDQLEQQTETSIDAHVTLVEVLLATLTDSADANELAQNWARVSEHFATLFTTEQSIEALKQTLLQLAVMGKLVPQDPADEPAAVLLEKIAAEKAQLIKDKKIKPQKLLPPIAEEEQLFDLPPGWGWCRLDDICNGITSGSTPPKSFFSEDKGVPYLKVYNIKNQQIDFEYKSQFVEENYHASTLKRSLLVPGDVVMNIVGPPLGKIAIIPSTYPEWNCNQAIVMFRPIVSELNKYIYTYLISGMFLDKIELIGTAGQDNISVTKSRSILLPTPPVLEQHRIVAKVDELMKICDQLKANLQQSQETQVQLTDALIDQALE